MLELTNVRVGNIAGAIHGMRQPFKGTSNSDSIFGIAEQKIFSNICGEWFKNECGNETEKEFDSLWDFYQTGILGFEDGAIDYALIGPKDLELAQRLVKAGSPHDKFLRQIFVSFDITAPLYW